MASGAISVSLINPNFRSSFSGSPTAAFTLVAVVNVSAVNSVAVATENKDFLMNYILL